MESQYITIKDVAQKTDDTTDLPTRITNSQVLSTAINLLPHTSVTTASSRKSSFSEYCGTPPNSGMYYNPTISASEFASQLKSNSRIAEIVPYPKCFCAKFSGLPRNTSKSINFLLY